MFVSPAFAQAAGGAAGGPSTLESFLPIILMVVVFYFLLIRPQQKKMKQHKAMLNTIRRGDRVVTGGGILGTVKKVIDDNEVSVEIADGITVRVQRQTISMVISKTEPVSGATKSAGSGGKSSANDDPSGDGPSGGKASGLKKLLGGDKK